MSVLGRVVSMKVVAGIALVMIVAALLPVMTTTEPRVITLVAKDMAFYLESDPTTPNPTIEAKAGEKLRVVLRNQERGMTHDFTVSAAHAATKLLGWNEQGDVEFETPDAPGTYAYVCRPHLLMMKGTLRVIP